MGADATLGFFMPKEVATVRSRKTFAHLLDVPGFIIDVARDQVFHRPGFRVPGCPGVFLELL
jgi:hypothetical protein